MELHRNAGQARQSGVDLALVSLGIGKQVDGHARVFVGIQFEQAPVSLHDVDRVAVAALQVHFHHAAAGRKEIVRLGARRSRR